MLKLLVAVGVLGACSSESMTMDASTGDTQLAQKPWIAFVSSRAGNFDIFLVHSDGTGLHPLVDGPGDDLYPAWAPDGAKLAFASNRSGNEQIYVVDVEGGAPQMIATGLVRALYPAWAPDGTTLALQGPGGLYLVGSEGGTAWPLTAGGFRDNSPVFTPDGKVIYFSSNRSGSFDVWSVAPDGTDLHEVTTGTNLIGGPCVSRDGKTLAFAIGSGSTAIAFWSLGQSLLETFSQTGDSEPDFSPEGDRLALTSTRYADNNPEIVVVGIPGGTNPFRLTDDPAVDGQATFEPVH